MTFNLTSHCRDHPLSSLHSPPPLTRAAQKHHFTATAPARPGPGPAQTPRPPAQGAPRAAGGTQFPSRQTDGDHQRQCSPPLRT